MKADKTSNDSEREPQTSYIKAGVHKAIIYSIVDTGTQSKKDTRSPTGTKLSREVKITWELPGVKKVFSEEKGEQVCVVSNNYTLSMRNSNLKKLAETLLNVSLTEEDAKDFDLNLLLGMGCRLQLVHNGDWVNIKSVMALDEGEDLGMPENDTVIFDLDEYDHEEWKKIYPALQEKIKLSPEWQALEIDEDGLTKAQREKEDAKEAKPFGENPEDIPVKKKAPAKK